MFDTGFECFLKRRKIETFDGSLRKSSFLLPCGPGYQDSCFYLCQLLLLLLFCHYYCCYCYKITEVNFVSHMFEKLFEPFNGLKFLVVISIFSNVILCVAHRHNSWHTGMNVPLQHIHDICRNSAISSHFHESAKSRLAAAIMYRNITFGWTAQGLTRT